MQSNGSLARANVRQVQRLSVRLARGSGASWVTAATWRHHGWRLAAWPYSRGARCFCSSALMITKPVAAPQPDAPWRASARPRATFALRHCQSPSPCSPRRDARSSRGFTGACSSPTSTTARFGRSTNCTLSGYRASEQRPSYPRSVGEYEITSAFWCSHT